VKILTHCHNLLRNPLHWPICVLRKWIPHRVKVWRDCAHSIVFFPESQIPITSENKPERLDSDNQINISRLISFLARVRRAHLGACRSSQGSVGQRWLGRHSTCELPPFDGRLVCLLHLLYNDRHTKFPRLGRSESDMGASESPCRSLHPIEWARSGFTSRPSESSRVLEPHMIWWPQPWPICTHIGPNLTGG
jgi:hypothetical protein